MNKASCARGLVGVRAAWAAAVIGVCGSAAGPAKAQCQDWWREQGKMGWWNGPGLWRSPSRVSTMKVFDIDGDGPGLPLLVAGGPATALNMVVTWDGRAWGPMSAGLAGDNPWPYWLCTHDFDGSGPEPERLIVVGDNLRFTPEIEHGVNVGWWDGERWLSVAPASAAQLNEWIWQAVSYDADGNGPGLPRLVVCGPFNIEVGGERLTFIAQWDGAKWAAMSSVNDAVHSVCVHDPDGPGPAMPLLIAGGEFTNIGGVAMARVAAWDGAQWSALGAGLGGSVYTVSEVDLDGPEGPASPALMAGGAFSGFMSRWNGSVWEALPGTGLGRNVTGMTMHDSDGPGPGVAALYAGTGGAGSLFRVYRYGAGGWEQVGDPTSDVDVLASFDADGTGPGASELVASGIMTQMVEPSGSFYCGRFAAWNGERWRTLGSSISASSGRGVYSATMFDADGDGPRAPEIVIAGLIDNAGEGPGNSIARWRTAEEGWQPLGLGLGGGTPQVYSVAAWDADGDGPGGAKVVAGGRFTLAGGASAMRIAAWDGDAWSALPGLSSDVTEVFAYEAVDGGPQELIAVSANLVYRWNGSGWTRLGTGTSTLGPISCVGGFALTGAARDLLVGSEGGVHRWTGTAWSRVGTLERAAQAMVSYDVDGDGPGGERLVIGADDSVSAGVTALMYWTGSAWVHVGGGAGAAGSAVSLTVMERGLGLRPLLVAVGSGLKPPGATLGSAALGWDGEAWSDERHAMSVTGSVRTVLAERISAPGSATATLLFGGDRLVVPDSATPAGAIGIVQRWTPAPPPIMVREARDQALKPGQTAKFEIEARLEPAGSLVYAWHRGEAPLTDGATGTGSQIQGAATPALEVVGAGSADNGEYWCLVSSGCGSLRSVAAVLSAVCPVDLNGDGVVDFGDYLEFLNLFDAGDARVDFNADGVVDFGDYLEFLNLYEEGC